MEALGDEPRLRVVDEPSLSTEGDRDSTSSPASPSGTEKPGTRRAGRLWLWALLGLLLGLGIAYQQYSRAEDLAGQVEALNATLLEAERQIQAYDTRFRDMRVRVSALDQHVDALKLLVETDPLQPVPQTPDPTPPSSQSR